MGQKGFGLEVGVGQLVQFFQGIAAILNDLSDKSSTDTSSVELLTAVQMGEQKVMAQAFELLLSELDFDVKSWKVHLRKVKEWDLRVWHQKDLWQIDRHNSAKSAAQDILKKKARTAKGQNILFKM